jgi:cytochrome P450
MRTSSDFAEPPFANVLALPPGPRGLPVLGSALDLFRRPLTTVIAARERFGDIVRFRAGPFDFITIHDPEDIRHVLVGNHRNYVKSRNYQGMKMVLGEGLVTSDGDHWRRQRKLAQPGFHRERLAGFVDTMVECTRDRIEAWGSRDGDTPVDVHHEMMELTFRIVGRTLFSMELGEHADAVGPAIKIALDHANAQVENMWPVPTWIPTPANFRFRRAMKALDRLVFDIIETRRRDGGDHADLLAMLMSATDESGTERMSDRQLRDEVLTLALAGHETTANALSFTWYLLSKHPEVERRLFEEVREVLGDADPTLADLERLEYTGWVVNEAMRSYPPAWMFERQALAADELSGHRIPKGAIIGICPWSVHRHPGLWENPEGFDPERFSPERSKGRPRYAFIPFGGGPRTCIGNHFAIMELKILIAMIARRKRLTLVPGEEPELDPGITLRPAHGIRMRLRSR